jgi:hypothetical protein
MNTGHDGSLTTLHANDTRDALNRLELLVGLSGVDIAVSVLRGYVASALTLLVHVSRQAGGARKVTRVSELIGLKKGRHYRVRDIITFDQTGVVKGGAVGTFRATGYAPQRALMPVYLGVSPEAAANALQWDAHPPVSVLVALSFGLLEYRDAHFVWNLLNLLHLVLALVAVRRGSV